MCSADMHTMCLEQLNHLWNLDFLVCAALTGLPLRSCSAKPSIALSEEFPPMKEGEFRQLKQDVLQMWVRAAHFFKFKKVDGKGWGIFYPSHDDTGYPTTGFLSPTKHTVMGWLAKAPNDEQCCTAHRYLRSPIGENLYLGGPASFMNHDTVGRVSVHTPSGHNVARHLVTVLSTRAKIPGAELVWTYTGNFSLSQELIVICATEWFLTECCSEVEASVLDGEGFLPSTLPAAASEPPRKKRTRVVGGIRPLVRTGGLPRFCLCTYCGINVDEEKTYSPNLKRHLSLYHAVDIVKDIGKDPMDLEDPVTVKEFTLQLDKVDNVLDGLHKRFISYQPACKFLKKFGEETQLRECQPVEEEKERVFHLFIQESKHAFKNYEVVYLKGVTVPTKYEDLVPCSIYTNHGNVVWEDEKPSNTNFSINKLGLQAEEREAHKIQVEMTLKEIITNYEFDHSEL